MKRQLQAPNCERGPPGPRDSRTTAMTTIALPTTVTALPLRKPARAKGTPLRPLGSPAAPAPVVAAGGRVTGGMTVTGRWRVSGGCVVVANHSSRRHRRSAGSALATARRCSRGGRLLVRCAGAPVRGRLAGRCPGCRAAGRRLRRTARRRPSGVAGRALRGDLSGGHPLDRWRNRRVPLGRGAIGAGVRGRSFRSRSPAPPTCYPRAAPTAGLPMAVHIGEPVDAGHVSPSQLRNRSWPYATVAGRGMPRCGGRREGSDGSGPRGDHRGEPGGEQYRRNDQIHAVVAAQPRVQQLRQHPDHQPHHRDAQPPLQ